jgi:hypothetical protein
LTELIDVLSYTMSNKLFAITLFSKSELVVCAKTPADAGEKALQLMKRRVLKHCPTQTHVEELHDINQLPQSIKPDDIPWNIPDDEEDYSINQYLTHESIFRKLEEVLSK